MLIESASWGAYHDSEVKLVYSFLLPQYEVFYHDTVEPVYYGYLGTSQKCPDYQGVLIFSVSLHNNVSFGSTFSSVGSTVRDILYTTNKQQLHNEMYHVMSCDHTGSNISTVIVIT